MHVSFEEFIRDSKYLSDEKLDIVDDRVQSESYTFYRTLVLCAKSIGISQQDVIKWWCEYSPDYGQIETSKNMQINMDAVTSMGGESILATNQVIPLVNKGGGHLFIFHIPDIATAQQSVQSYELDNKYDKFVCNDGLWNILWSLYIEPLEIRIHAQHLTSGVSAAHSDDIANTSEIRRLYSRILNNGYTKRASDIHFIPCVDSCRINLRIDGHNQEYTSIPLEMLERICVIMMNDGHCGMQNPNEPVDGKVKFVMEADGQEHDLRFSIIPSKYGKDLNVRYLSTGLLTFEELGMSSVNIAKYKRILSLPQGLVVQVGPTGSGKTTTLYTGLNYVRQTLANIITIEDPVEIFMEGITQLDVESSMSVQNRLTFPLALKASLRHDPDIIVVGEMRDRSTAEEALIAATTGHLVLASLHTNDSISVFERLHHMGVEPYALGEVLVAIMSQRLVRRLCPKCKAKTVWHVGKEESAKWGIKKEGDYTVYSPVGCEECGNTGYKGRIAINEILEIDPGLRDLIQRRAMRSDIEAYIRNMNVESVNERKPLPFRSMYTDGMGKVMEGVTSLEEMDMFAKDRTAFKG